MTARGHNGGPPLDEGHDGSRPAAALSVAGGTCRWCRPWKPLQEREERDYEAFRNGASRRRVKRPAGACDRVLRQVGKPVAFSSTAAEFSCLNFEERPLLPRPKGSGFVTIWRGGRIVWQGHEEDVPAEQMDLGL